MNLSQFFDHWKITENPFRGEEARHDAVFTRMSFDVPDSPDGGSVHSDFEKILGDMTRPSTAVVFGEKGSGKTAIRMQIAGRAAAHNNSEQGKNNRIFLISYDDLNGYLDRMHDLTGKDDPLETFQKIRLVDHMDAMLSLGVTRLTDVALGAADDETKAALGPEVGKRLRQASRSAKRDLLALQAVYDRHESAGDRTTILRRRLRLPIPRGVALSKGLAYAGWLLPAAVLGLALGFEGFEAGPVWQYAFLACLGLYLIALIKRLAWDVLSARALARKVRRAIRIIPRGRASWAQSLEQLDTVQRAAAVYETSGNDEDRYAMLARLRRVLSGIGFGGILVVVDRVDEPTLVSGDAERMRAIVWPMFNNKFLQQEGLGVKMLLPIELRFALFKESNAFFQEARLDKQNLVERLTWTGAMLYDLCNARLRACLAEGSGELSLLDLFAEDVSRQDLVDALNEMHQPRDAFKFVYRCLTEHCSNVTTDQNDMRIPRLVLEQIRKAESDRVQQLYRGIRPA
ncbi:MAG: hypothetical protein AAGB51_14195 [Planctomycetota bacterium]